MCRRKHRPSNTHNIGSRGSVNTTAPQFRVLSIDRSAWRMHLNISTHTYSREPYQNLNPHPHRVILTQQGIQSI